MNKTLARVLAAILVLCMLPATFLTALAGGLGVAKNETENQSIDNANGQYIPETIVIDGKFDDTGWAIEGWSYVTASTGNWNVESPDKDAQTMMYQYQLRADYKYFYAGAVVVLPANMNSAQFKVYLSDDASTYKTASLFTVSLDKTATEKGTLVVKDCDSSDSVSVALNGDLFKCEYLGDGKFYIEFRNAAANSYNTASDVQIKYYVSLDVQVDGEWQSLYHPVYTTANNGHAVPTSEYWPGGGNLLEVGYTDLEVRHNGSQKNNGTSINPGTDGYKGAVTLDGLFNEDIWKGLTDYYTLDKEETNLVDFVDADKGIVGGLSGNMYTGTSSHLADTSTVHWLPNNLVAGNEYSTIVENIYTLTNGTSGTHESYDDTDHKELTDGITLNDYEYLNTDTDGGKYHNPNFVVWNVDAKNKEGQVGMDVRIPLGNGADTYPLQVVNIYTGTLKCNKEWSSSGGTSSNGIRNQAYTVEYTSDGITWLPFGTVAKEESYDTTYIRKNVVSVSTPVYAKGIRITSTGTSSLAFVSEIEAFASTAVANKSTTYTTENKANDPTFVGKYDFRTDDEYFYGALITTSRAITLKVGNTTVTTKYGDYTKTGYKYEFKVKKAGLDFDSGVSVTIDGVLYNGMIVNHFDNDASDDVNYDGKLTDSIWAPVTAGDKEFYYASNSGNVFSDFETLIYDVKSDYEYIYGAAIVKLEDIDTWEQENSKLRLYINPRGEAGGATDLNYYVVEMYYTDQNVTDKSFARILKYDGKVVQTEDITYRWSELCYIRRDEANNTLTFEFKIPYKLFSWKGVNEQKTTKTQKHNDFFTDISKSDSDIAFTYMMSLYERDIASERFFSKELIPEKRAMTMNLGSVYVNYKDNCVDVTYGDFIDTVAIDGHIDEGVWQDKDFYQANFSNSTLLTQPTKGEVYDYSYMLYGGSNYIYGAVELNDIAREGTTFTLWLNNFVDEYKWIGDNDSKTPFITYDIYQHTTQQTQYNQKDFILNNEGEVAALSLGTTLPYTANRLQYYTNYKYEFDLSAAKSTATPDYYFATDSNLEKDKTWIKEGVNYKYAITTINGKTYLEFMIDVDNFHWDYNSFEYVTSMTHTVSGEAGNETLTVYHPEINDRANFWLTNANVDNGYRHDGSGNLFTSATDYAANNPPTIYWQSLKLEPVGNNQYKIIEMTDTSTKWVLQNGSVQKLTYTKTAYPKVADWHKYTEEEASKGIIYYTHFTGSLYEDGQLILDIDNQQLRYPWARPADFRKVEKTIDGKTYVAYINRSSFDGRSPRAELSKNIFLGWSVGDVIEMGYQGTDQIENKKGTDKSKNVLSVSALLDHEELLSASELDINADFYGRPWNEFADEKDMPEGDSFGNKVGITSYSYVEQAEVGGGTNVWDDQGNKKLTDGEKLTQNLSQGGNSVVLYMYNGDGSKSKSEGIIANIAANTQTNVYTAYLNAGDAGVYAGGANMEIWGSNDGTSWQRVTGVSYRQLLLRKGDGMDYGTISNGAGATNPTLSISGNNSVYAGRTDWKTILQDKKTDENAITGDKDSTNHSAVGSPAVLFENKNLKSEKYGEDTIGFVLDYGSSKVTTNKLIVGTYNVPDWSVGRPANRVTIQYWDGSEWKHAETISLQGDTAMFDKHTFTLSKSYEATKFKVIFNYTYNSSKGQYNKYIGLTELRLSYTDVDSYTLTAIADEPVKYSKIKFVFYEASSASNYIALDEIEVSYSADIAKLPTKNILHLNTKQGTTAVDTNGEYTTFKGRYNTEGETWKNTGDSMVDPVSTSKTSYPNNVFAETVVTPGYGYNITSDVGFYTNFYIERVSSNVDQSNRPDDSGTNKWDKATNGILKKLEHIAPDVIDVDGDLGDTGWDGVWTDVDGLKNATNFNGTGTDFKYQLRADGEYLYVAAIIDAAYASANPEFKLWIKSYDAATTFTHLYSAGKGETVLAIGAQATDSNGVVDDPYLVYGKENVDGSITLNGAFGAVQNDSSTPNGLSKLINKNNYLDSAIFGYTKEVVESTHDGVGSWTENPITQGHRVALEHGYIGSAAGKSVGNAIGTDSQTIVEFRVALSEFGGADGFEYFVEATTTSGSTIYPHIYTEKGYDEYHHPSWSWDSSSAKKVTAEDMTGWGIYRMVNDYAPMTSLGAKVNPSYGANNQKAIRFGARYTEEFIRRQATVEGTDYWDVETAGIVFVPTHVIPTYNPYDLTVETSTAKVVEALDIVNWKNDTPDGSTNFADYTSFVFYVNLVGIPDNAVNMEFSFRGFVDYYGKVSGSDTYYGIPLERSYSLVDGTELDGVIDDVRNAELYDYSVKIENGNGVDYYTGYNANNIAKAESLLCDGNAPYYLGSLSSSHHDADKTSYAYLFKNTDPAKNADCTFSTILTYEQEVAFDTVDLGLYMIPRWKIAPPKSVTVYVKENGVWVEKETIDDIYPYTVEVMQGIGISSDAGNELSRALSVSLGEKYVAQEIKLEFTFPEFVYILGMTDVDSSTNWNEFQFVGLTEVGLSIR